MPSLLIREHHGGQQCLLSPSCKKFATVEKVGLLSSAIARSTAGAIATPSQ
ncbi:hypothetical protein CKA32_001086 [Geitlerinema sp. FC II]|nr:hypothetical protein CKA32_001086 [Geitlerinema sp. FC II]